MRCGMLPRATLSVWFPWKRQQSPQLLKTPNPDHCYSHQQTAHRCAAHTHVHLWLSHTHTHTHTHSSQGQHTAPSSALCQHTLWTSLLNTLALLTKPLLLGNKFSPINTRPSAAVERPSGPCDWALMDERLWNVMCVCVCVCVCGKLISTLHLAAR